jgi:hypothetical protein
MECTLVVLQADRKYLQILVLNQLIADCSFLIILAHFLIYPLSLNQLIIAHCT